MLRVDLISLCIIFHFFCFEYFEIIQTQKTKMKIHRAERACVILSSLFDGAGLHKYEILREFERQEEYERFSAEHFRFLGQIVEYRATHLHLIEFEWFFLFLFTSFLEALRNTLMSHQVL